MKCELTATVLFLSLTLLTGCLAETDKSVAEPLYLRLASAQSENYVTNQACTLFCETVRKRSEGKICIEPYFDSELGNEADTLEQCRLGGIDFVRVSAAGAAKYAPLLTALQMPYEYTSDKHLFRVLDSHVGRAALDSLESSGLYGVTYFYAGYRCFFSTTKPLASIEDMQGLRLRVTQSPVMAELVGLWGAYAVQLEDDEIAAALRSAAIDGAESTLPVYVDSGYYRLAPYWVYDQHTYNADVLVASLQTKELLSEDEWELVAECAAEAAAWQREHWLNAEVRAMMQASRSGCSMSLLDAAEAERFRQAAQPLYDALTSEQKQVVEEANLLADP